MNFTPYTREYSNQPTDYYPTTTNPHYSHWSIDWDDRTYQQVPLPEPHPCQGAFHIDTLELDHVFILSDDGWVLYSPVGVAVPFHLHRRPHIKPPILIDIWPSQEVQWSHLHRDARFISTQ